MMLILGSSTGIHGSAGRVLAVRNRVTAPAVQIARNRSGRCRMVDTNRCQMPQHLDSKQRSRCSPLGDRVLSQRDSLNWSALNSTRHFRRCGFSDDLSGVDPPPPSFGLSVEV